MNKTFIKNRFQQKYEDTVLELKTKNDYIKKLEKEIETVNAEQIKLNNNIQLKSCDVDHYCQQIVDLQNENKQINEKYREYRHKYLELDQLNNEMKNRNENELEKYKTTIDRLITNESEQKNKIYKSKQF